MSMPPARPTIIATVASILCVALGGIFYGQRLHTHKSNTPQRYDIVVVGAGTGGVGASIQAARMGAHVALLEPTDWIGGQMTAAGVGNMDEGSKRVRSHGLYGEFIQEAISFYQAKHTSVGTCYGGTDSICIAPHVGQDILRHMLQKQSKNLQVFTGLAVSGVTKNGNTITSIEAGGKTFESKVVIDATEYGDVLPLAGADFRLGNGTNDEPKPNSCIQNMTYTAVIKKYPGGAPDKLTFKKPPTGYTPDVVNHFKTALARGFDAFLGFRGFPDPPATAAQTNAPATPNPQTGAGITRTSLNLDVANDYPPKGSLSAKFVSDPHFRADAICKAKLLTLQLIYYIQHDLGHKDWSIANDEGYDTAYNQQHRCTNLSGLENFEDQLAQIPYVREARRMIGTETLTGHEVGQSWRTPKDIVRQKDSIAVGYYPMDIHGCRSAPTLETAFDAADDAPRVHKGGPFEVPMGALISQNVDGLLAAEKNISVSRLANGAIREQPITMDVGQAAGALAALAVQHNESPRQVPASDVQTVLTAANLETSFIK